MATVNSVTRQPKSRGTDPTGAEDGKDANGAVESAAESIRDMIRGRELLPGEPVRQQDMATLLEVSRVPIREALTSLEKEGLLKYERNRGYFVSKLSGAQLLQIYRMAELLESAMLEEFEWPDQKQLKAIASVNKKLATAARTGQFAELEALNREFHEAVFGLSRFELIHSEVRRLWEMAASYRALYLAGPARTRIAAEHDEIIDALRRRDLKLLTKRLNEHRGNGLKDVTPMLGH